jgi:CelD/BcsL family acetyltransferase involved in cellulose biosynthesis
LEQLFTTQLIESWDEFNTLKEEWDSVLKKTPADSIFLSWQWMDAWRQAIEEQISPFILLVRDQNNRLVAIAPFYISEYRFLGIMPIRVIRCMGDFPTGSEYPDIMVLPDYEMAAIKEIANILIHSNVWDAVWMPKMAGWTGALQRFQALSEQLNSHFYKRESDFSNLDLPASFDQYMSNISSSHRSQIKRQAKKILAEPNINIIQCTTVEQIPHFIDALFKLHAKRWQSIGEQGTFNRKPLEARFYRLFLPHALGAGWLRMYLLELEHEAKAVQVGYCYNQTYLQLQEGFDPESYPGIGNFLRQKSLELMIDEGIMAYDFLGGHTEHKRRWGSVKRTGYEVFFIRKSVKSLPFMLRDIWPTGRYLKEITHTKIANKLTT